MTSVLAIALVVMVLLAFLAMANGFPILGGAVAWPLAARRSRANASRRIGVLMGYDENDPLAQSINLAPHERASWLAMLRTNAAATPACSRLPSGLPA